MRQLLAGLALVIVGVTFILGKHTGWHLYVGIGWIIVGASYIVIGSQTLRQNETDGAKRPRRSGSG